MKNPVPSRIEPLCGLCLAGLTASGCVTPYRVTRMPRGGRMRVVMT